MNGFAAPEIEQAVISAMLQWPQCVNEGVERLTKEHFNTPANRTLYIELGAAWEKGEPIDLILFTQRLREKRLLEQIGGAYYVTHTYASVCHSPALFPYYVEILSEELSKRELVSTCSGVAKSDLQGVEDPVGETITQLSEIPTLKKPARNVIQAMNDKMERMETGEPDSDIIKTGLTRLDIYSPLRRGDMPLIAGERKSGKSILALTIASNIAQRGLGVLYFSLEDREPKVIDRLFAGLSRIPMNEHHVRRFDADQMQRASESTTKMGSLKFIIRDDILDLTAIMASARQAVVQKRCDLIIVDYAQLVRVKNSETRRDEVEKVSRDLRLLAMELNTPLLLISQLNQNGATRETKALEMDATAMWKVDKNGDESNERFIRIPWQRNGESGLSFPVTFLGSIARFENFVAEKKAA